MEIRVGEGECLRAPEEKGRSHPRGKNGGREGGRASARAVRRGEGRRGGGGGRSRSSSATGDGTDLLEVGDGFLSGLGHGAVVYLWVDNLVERERKKGRRDGRESETRRARSIPRPDGCCCASLSLPASFLLPPLS